MKLILRLLITAAVAFGLQKILSGIHIDTYGTAIVFAIVLGLLNLIVKPILQILAFPITLLILGLFWFVVTALVTGLAAAFVTGVRIDGFGWALLFSLLLPLISSALSKALKLDKS
ncbi:MAG: phage holin family protein [Sphingobacteriales bacterium]|nr:MAG: phage holin family protein [Sphingobacteriales bacterium]